METGFFVSVAALGLEMLVFVLTIIYVAFQALRGGAAWSSKLWWPVGVTALAGAVAFVFSAHHVVNTPRHQSWVAFVALSIVLPLLLAMVVASTLRRQSKRT